MDVERTEVENRQYRRELFIKLLLMLRAGALQHLGQLTNPLTNERKVNMELARETIDMLDLMREKTAGNLSEPESEMLNNLISELQVAYVEVSTKGADEI